jgi:hypothetical protein
MLAYHFISWLIATRDKDKNDIASVLLILTNIWDCCMQFVETNMGGQVSRVLIDALGGFLKMEDVVTGTLFLT